MKLEIISIIVAVISLLISGIIFWYDFLRSFNPRINTVGRVIISNDPYKPDESRIAIILPLIFNNVGAKLGIIEDLAIILETPDGRNTLFRSLTEYLENTLNFTAELPPRKMQPFYGFSLNKRETINRTVLFKQEDYGQNFNLVIGTYNLHLFYRSSKTKEWSEFGEHKLTFKIEGDDINALNKKTVQTHPDGSYFIKVIEQNKPLDYAESAINKLKEKL